MMGRCMHWHRDSVSLSERAQLQERGNAKTVTLESKNCASDSTDSDAANCRLHKKKEEKPPPEQRLRGSTHEKEGRAGAQ